MNYLIIEFLVMYVKRFIQMNKYYIIFIYFNKEGGCLCISVLVCKLVVTSLSDTS